MDSRCRYHREAALWPSGRGGGELQPAQAGTAVAQLSLLHARQLASDPGGGSASRQSSYVEAFGTGPVAPAGRAFADRKAHAAARRRWLGQRAGHAGGGAAWPALSVQIAPDEWGEACDRASDEPAGLAR